MFNITTWFSQDIGFSQILGLVPLIVFFFFSHSKTVHYTGWCHCIFPPTAYDDSFSSRLSPEFIFLDLWWWPLWVVKFYFPLSFWLTFLQHLGNISIMSCGGDLHLFCFVFFFFSLKGMITIYLWQLISWKSAVFQIFLQLSVPGHFFRAAVIPHSRLCHTPV